MQDLNIAMVQYSPVWEDATANRRLLDRLLQQVEPPVDLIVLPEMFATGFSMNAAALAESMSGPSVQWMLQTASDRQAVVMGSLIVSDGGRYFNRLLLATPQGGIAYADKRHLFRMMGEERVYAPGKHVLEVSLKGWRIRGFVCYDLRFPVWMRNRGNSCDLAIVVANWPRARRHHWRSLLVARAIENQMMVVGVNRVGTDGSGLAFSGDSMVVDATGEILGEWSGSPVVAQMRIDGSSLEQYRSDFPAWMDADGFCLE
ncbi:amidohydrolase [Desulfatirhabdium butyrativorans]|uniref:amidohydrolase n=1 Tax=Desulfatirhabdium butyrativorans TaxID=340467 RepID=UPI000425783C|nr:amidohydrolase [Desulfatirhabdium butyrativorans]